MSEKEEMEAVLEGTPFGVQSGEEWWTENSADVHRALMQIYSTYPAPDVPQVACTILTHALNLFWGYHVVVAEHVREAKGDPDAVLAHAQKMLEKTMAEYFRGATASLYHTTGGALQ